MKSTSTAHPEPSLPDEARLIRQAKSGDAEAFAQLYDAYVERVYRYIYFRVSDEATTEDLTSQVFLKAWENLHRYQPGNSPYLAWLYTTARNLVIDHYRSRKESVPLDEITPRASEERTPDEESDLRSELRSMRAALRSLTDEQQQVLTLKFIAGLPNRDIARMMNKREGAIRALQMRALQSLSKRMKEKEMI